jgi:hypothetical protein
VRRHCAATGRPATRSGRGSHRARKAGANGPCFSASPLRAASAAMMTLACVVNAVRFGGGRVGMNSARITPARVGCSPLERGRAHPVAERAEHRVAQRAFVPWPIVAAAIDEEGGGDDRAARRGVASSASTRAFARITEGSSRRSQSAETTRSRATAMTSS